MQEQAVSKQLDENIAWWKQQFSDCADIKMRPMCLGRDMSIRAFLSYIEVTGGKNMMEDSVLGKMLNRLNVMEPQQVYAVLHENGLGVSDVTPFAQMSEAAGGMLTGDSILFVDGFDRALKIPDKGYPGMSLQKTESEKAIRGSNEGFGDSIKQNTALIRKRLRSVDLKVAECKCGRRTGTNVDIMYLDGIVRPEIVTQMQQRLAAFEIDGIGDSGVIEQLTETQWFSPFPQYQTTRRPDRAVMALLEGRAVLLVDNSPEVLIFPTDYNSFIKTTDDYYTRWEIATFTRTLRYVAAFLSMILPGLYLAMTNFHTQLLPTKLLLSFAAARQGVPFPGVVEVLLMELSFELLREAGVRLPGASSSAPCSRCPPPSPNAIGPRGVLMSSVPCGLPSSCQELDRYTIASTGNYLLYMVVLWGVPMPSPGTTRCITTIRRHIWTSWTTTPLPIVTTNSCT